MMSNLFMSFEPSSTMLMFQANWISMIIIFMFLPYMLWMKKSRFNKLWVMMNSLLIKEFSNLISKKNIMISSSFLSLFLLIMMNNTTGLMPFIFTASSHLSFTLPLSLTLWLGYMTFGVMTNLKNMMTHLVPQSTPTPLIPLMVLIETISNLIRPMTLAVRLAANMIAGHLLMVLMSSMIPQMNLFNSIVMVLIQSALVILETSVSFIQAYVFTILSVLYVSELL
uniref:ATP synthase subunit a n=1 Tax=Dimorphostylis asiatica TaxID=2840398 RepID=A0A8F8AG49_9CRUS|nr:ATP synthase F0 subunit 6 [Dimorphostylis asiatica]